jgi:hypothetical protein
MKEKFLQWWDNYLNGVLGSADITRAGVLKLAMAAVLLIFAAFLLGRCGKASANDKDDPKPTPTPSTVIITNTQTHIECDHKCKRHAYIRGARDALGIAGTGYFIFNWPFNQKGSEKKPVEVGVQLRQ